LLTFPVASPGTSTRVRPDFSSDAWLNLDVPCGHLETRSSPVGSSWTVSTGLPINSVPLGAVRYNGLLLKKQWYDILADTEATGVIFAPSWNEFGSRACKWLSSPKVPKRVVLTSASLISSRITDNLSAKTGATNPAFYAAGAAPDDPNRYVLFEDGYAAQRSRSIEPSVEDGGRKL